MTRHLLRIGLCLSHKWHIWPLAFTSTTFSPVQLWCTHLVSTKCHLCHLKKRIVQPLFIQKVFCTYIYLYTCSYLFFSTSYLFILNNAFVFGNIHNSLLIHISLYEDIAVILIRQHIHKITRKREKGLSSVYTLTVLTGGLCTVTKLNSTSIW